MVQMRIRGGRSECGGDVTDEKRIFIDPAPDGYISYRRMVDPIHRKLALLFR